MAVDYYSPARGRSTTKKALLIGIGYRKTEESDEELSLIPTSIPNVKKFKQFLQDQCKYTDITVMTDEDGVEERFQPTIVNLEREIRALGRDVKPGDRRVFYFAGHSDQMPCRTGSEEDNMDEALVTLNGSKIRDNDLHKWLVKDLPPGSALTAIFDSCTSGTLLDLPHYRCNNVYRPWVNKGRRRTDTIRNCVVRKDDGYVHPVTRSLSGSSVGSGDQLPSLGQVSQTMGARQSTPPWLDEGADEPRTRRRTSPERPSKRDGWSWLGEGADELRMRRSTSPEHLFKCDGWCEKEMQTAGTLPHADVISISSSNDGQRSWDASTANGGCLSMTSFLIKILREDPKLTYTELMTRLNHAVYSFTKRMHGDVRRRKNEGRKARGMDGAPKDIEAEDEGEMDNFQDLQLGSITPLNMDQFFTL